MGAAFGWPGSASTAREPAWAASSRSIRIPSARNAARRQLAPTTATSRWCGAVTIRMATDTGSSASASTAARRRWARSSRSTRSRTTSSTMSTLPRTWAGRSSSCGAVSRTVTSMGFSDSASPAARYRWAPSSRSIHSPRGSTKPRAWRQTMRVTSWSCGRTTCKTATTTASSASGLRARALPAAHLLRRAIRSERLPRRGR